MIHHPCRTATREDIPTILGFIRELAALEGRPEAVTATVSDLESLLFGPRPLAEAVIMASDLKDYADFNAVYRTYFKGPLPARAFIGAGSLQGNARFEVMGIAAKAK